MAELFPPSEILVGAAILSAARFENQRWVRAQANTPQSRFDLNFVAVLVGFAAMVFGLVFWIAVGYDFGWLTMAGLAMVTFLAAIAWSVLSALISAKVLGVRESFGIWVLGTILIIPAIIWLAPKVSWFGILS